LGGHVEARHNLGVIEGRAGNMDRAVKHYMIAAGMGNFKSLETIKLMFKDGHATKDDYAKALRAYQTHLVEIKSPQRDQAAAYSDEFKYY
jgi:TPR repeat protein